MGSITNIRLLVGLALVLFLVVFAFIYVILKLLSKKDPVAARLTEVQKYQASQGVEGKPNKQTTRREIKFRHIKIPEKVEKDIRESGTDLRAEEFVLGWVVLTCAPSALLFFLTGNLALAFVLAVTFAFLPIVFVSTKKKKRLEAFEEQLSEVLMLISNSLRSGFSFEQAFEVAAKDSQQPLSDEFSRAIRELNMGVDLDAALGGVVERTGSTNMKLVSSAVLVQRQVGGNLAEILDNISATIRSRIAIKKNIKTLTAQGRFSGLIIGILPVFLFIVISAINPGYMSVFTTTLLGRIMLGICIVFELVGILVIRNMVNIDM